MTHIVTRISRARRVRARARSIGLDAGLIAATSDADLPRLMRHYELLKPYLVDEVPVVEEREPAQVLTFRLRNGRVTAGPSNFGPYGGAA